MRETEFWNKLYLTIRWRKPFRELGGSFDWLEPQTYHWGVNTFICGEIGLIGGKKSFFHFEFRFRKSYFSKDKIDWKNALPPLPALELSVPQPTCEETPWTWMESAKIVMESPK